MNIENPRYRYLIAALESTFRTEYLALSESDKEKVLNDFSASDCDSQEYRKRIDWNGTEYVLNLQSYANCL